MKTLQDLRDLWYAILKEDSDTSAYPLVLMDSLLNQAQRSICSWSVFNLLDQRQLEKWPLPFLYTDSFYSTVQDTFLDGDTSVWATTLDVSDATNLPSFWVLWINYNIVTYTGKTSNQLTGVTWIWFAHKWWSRVSVLFSLASDFASAVRVNYNSLIDLKPVDYRNLYKQLNQYKNWYNTYNTNTNQDRFDIDIVPFYTIINWTYILPFQINNTWEMLHLLYEKKATTMTASTDEATIPDEYVDVVPYLAIWEFYYNRWEADKWLELLRFAYGKINEMYTYYTNQNSEKIYWQRIGTGKDAYLNI